MTVIPPRGAVPEFDAPALLEALKSASASAPLMTLLLGGRNVKALPAKHTYFNFYEDGIKKKKKYFETIHRSLCQSIETISRPPQSH
jgi:hypothetical protein